MSLAASVFVEVALATLTLGRAGLFLCPAVSASCLTMDFALCLQYYQQTGPSISRNDKELLTLSSQANRLYME